MEIIYKIDKLISEFDSKSKKEMSYERTLFRDLIQEYAGVEIKKDLTLPATVLYIEQSESKQKRNLSMILLYALSSDHIFNASDADGKLVQIFDKNVSDLYGRFNIDAKEQTHIKIKGIEKIHSNIIGILNNLSNIGNCLDSILSSRQKIEKTLNDSTLNAYLNYLDFDHIKKNINNNFNYISYFNDKPEKFYENIPLILREINNEVTYCDDNNNFLTRIYKVYLLKINEAIKEERISSQDKFKCSIKDLINNTSKTDKKYPFHINGREIRISLPFIVEGTGCAKNVQAEITSDTKNIVLIDSNPKLGDIKPGEFIVPIIIQIKKIINTVKVDIIIEWNITGDNERYEEIFEFTFNAQDPNVDWEGLKYLDPYSLEIVYGESFIGRKDAIRRICSRLLSPTVTSSYITGQKRVGKSSLAHAVIENGKNMSENYVFIYKEYGDYGNESAKETLNELGQQLADEIQKELTVSENELYKPTSFSGSLSPLIKLVTLLNSKQPKKKFVIVLDEFDEIHHDLYRIGSLAETFFSNLRALSGRANIGFILVGSEGMPYVISAQGDKLNKFTEESLDSFHRVNEWQDYENLIRMPVKEYIHWHNDALNTIYEETSGHPFFTKSICSPMINEAIRLSDSEITSDDVKHFLPTIISQLDVNIFAHFWKDGIDGDYNEKEIISLDRRRVLIAYARTIRNSEITLVQNITRNISGKSLNEDKVEIILNNFCIRHVMRENNSEYLLRVKLFENWLITKGINVIIPDQLGDKLSELKSIKEDEAYVLPDEIINLVNKWPLYQDNKITTDHIRSWLQQDKNLINQRIFFTLLENLEFPNEQVINQMLKDAHESLKSNFQGTNFVTKKKTDRRKDIIITYADEAGKSGAYYAQRYTRENRISTTSNIEVGAIKKALQNSNSISGLVIVDDFIGTGDSLSKNLRVFIEENIKDLKMLDIPVRVVVIYATVEGEENIRNTIRSLEYSDIDLYVCKSLGDSYFAFSENSKIWKNSTEKFSAKEICQKHGLKLSKKAPLGYRDQGLLLVFPRNCPNNSLTILHAKKSKNNFEWRPLFERIQAI